MQPLRIWASFVAELRLADQLDHSIVKCSPPSALFVTRSGGHCELARSHAASEKISGLCWQAPNLSFGAISRPSSLPCCPLFVTCLRCRSALARARSLGFRTSYLICITVTPSHGKRLAGGIDLRAVVLDIPEQQSRGVGNFGNLHRQCPVYLAISGDSALLGLFLWHCVAATIVSQYTARSMATSPITCSILDNDSMINHS